MSLPLQSPHFLTRSALLLLILAAVGNCGGDGGPSEPSVPADVSLDPTNLPFNALGQTQQLTATVTDQRGNPITDASVSWSSSDPAVVTVSPEGLVTAVGAGSAVVTAEVAELSATAAVSVVQAVAAFEAASGNAQPGVAGETLALPLIVRATDALGNPIAGLEVQFEVTQGGGSVLPASATTQADGTASCVFRLGNTVGGAQQVTVSVAGASTTATFTAAATESPAEVVPFAGNGQTARPGAAVPLAPSARVVDGDGTPVPGVVVAFAVTRGGGAVVGAAHVITGANGVATLGGWTLGQSGVNVLTASLPGQLLSGDPADFIATVSPTVGYDINVQYLGSPTSSQLLAFAEAEIRWESLITGDVPDLPLTGAAGDCGPGSPAFSRTVDDLVIFANLVPIDGPGAVLGQAGPCFVRLPGSLPAAGAMRFDTDDLELIEEGGLLPEVILHEMGHVIGIIRSVWQAQGFLEDASLTGGADPHFDGPLAIQAFDAAGGGTYPDGKVPVENTGGPGTADTHWRETVLGNELMTGFVSTPPNPLSAITVNSLDDQGYTVNLGGADNFTLGSGQLVAGARRGISLKDDVWRLPVRRVDRNGRVIDVVQPR
jgi:hypothetical protein